MFSEISQLELRCTSHRHAFGPEGGGLTWNMTLYWSSGFRTTHMLQPMATGRGGRALPRPVQTCAPPAEAHSGSLSVAVGEPHPHHGSVFEFLLPSLMPLHSSSTALLKLQTPSDALLTDSERGGRLHPFPPLPYAPTQPSIWEKPACAFQDGNFPSRESEQLRVGILPLQRQPTRHGSFPKKKGSESEMAGFSDLHLLSRSSSADWALGLPDVG